MISKEDIKQFFEKAESCKLYTVHFDNRLPVECQSIKVSMVGFDKDGSEIISYWLDNFDEQLNHSYLNKVEQAWSCKDNIVGVFESRAAAIEAAKQWKVHEAERKVEELKTQLKAAKEDLEALERTNV